MLRADDPAFVFFVETRGAGTFLRALPIEVSGIVRELVLDRARTTVLTSATLTIAGAFDYVRSRLGVAEAREAILASEFDHATQALLYLPRQMPDPRQPDFTSRAADEVIAILERTEGRAFVLFTSYASMHAVRERVARALPYPMLTQGTAPRGVLLETFRRTPNAVLFATSSFWQGVDVVGDALSCVIIDKLPFASPGDPIVAARLEAIAARGGDPFATLQVPLAILTLLQGLGRLLRHRDDRGILAILDPRLQTMGYGRRFLASLPPAPITRNLDDISRFMAASEPRLSARRKTATLAAGAAEPRAALAAADGLAEQPVDGVDQLFRHERLGEEGRAFGQPLIREDGLGVEPGDEERRQARPALPDAVADLGAAQPGHHDVGQQQVERALVAVEDGQRVVAVLGLEHRVAFELEQEPDDVPDHRVVLDEQDGASNPRTGSGVAAGRQVAVGGRQALVLRGVVPGGEGGGEAC